MDTNEPTFVPQWLKSSGGLSTTHQFTSASLPTDEQGISKTVRNKASVKSSDNELGHNSISDRSTSSYFRRTSISNDSAHLRSYSSFGRNHRDRDWDKDAYEFHNKEKSDNRRREFYDPLGNILPGRFEKDGLRRSHSSLSGKHGDSWTRKSASDLSIASRSSHNNGSALVSGGSSVKSVKISLERDFPTLVAGEKQVDPDIGRVPSPGLSSAIQSLPIGSSAVIGGDGWTSALAAVPVIVGSNGNNTSVAQPVQSTSISITRSMMSGRNMAETLAHGPPPRTQTAPQSTVGTQRLEELAVKQSRQLIPMTPSMPKALALNSSDKLKLKAGQSQLGNNLRPISVKSDVPKTSSSGKLLVLKPSWERNGISPTAKESCSPTRGGKLSNSPLALPSVVGSAPLRSMGNTQTEKRPSSQAQSRNNFFNLVRKKSMTSNSSVGPDGGSSDSSSTEKRGEPVAPSTPQCGSDTAMVNGPGCVQRAIETKVDITCNGDSCVGSTTNGKNHLGPDGILYSEEEEARFLRSLGWDETAEEEEGLTEEEISSFYRNYLNLKPSLKGTEAKLMMPIHSKMGEVSSNAKVDG